MLNVKGMKKEDLRVVAEELGKSVHNDLKMSDLKELIVKSDDFVNDPGFVMEFLASTVADRKHREEQEIIKAEVLKTKLELEERERERQHQLELARINQNMVNSSSSGSINSHSIIETDTCIEKLIKSIRTLTLPVPTKVENWNLFFSSIERAFQTKNIPEESKAEILINILGDKATNVLIYITGDELKNYESVKKLILREYEPSPQCCLDNFRKAKRRSNETHMQFMTRLVTTFEYYCELRKAKDFETLKQLIVADKMFQTLDSDTAAHICIRQGGSWFKPIEIAKECDLYFESKSRSLAETQYSYQKCQNNSKFQGTGQKYIPPQLRRDSFRNEENRNQGLRRRECYICKSTQHIQKFCPQRPRRPQTHTSSTDQQQVDTFRNDDAVVAKIRSKYFGNETDVRSKPHVSIQPLHRININIAGRDIEAIVDSGTQIPVLHPEDVTGLVDRDDYGTIILSSAFGEETSAKIVKIPMAIRNDRNRNLLAPIEVMGAITGKLKGPCLIPSETFKLLEEENKMFACADIKTIDDNNEVLQEIEGTEEINDNGVCSNIIMEGLNNNYKDEVIHENSNARLLEREQKECGTLESVRRELKQNKGNFILVDGLICHKDRLLGDPVVQLVLPEKRRKKVLALAHESVFGAHMGVRKTSERIRYSFYWPSMSHDIKEFCKSCENCQLRSPDKVSDRAPITPVLRPELPFEVVNVDVIGPIEPSSGRGHKYVLTIIDQHSRWPEAVPMRSLTAKSACEALLQVFSRTGIPNVIASDQGTNFTSALTQEFSRRIGASPRFSCPGYAASNGLVERWNKVLKQMLHHVIREDPRDWDRQIPFLLFAYREVPNCTTGVSPFRLLYGREARGPLAILKSTWAGEIPLPLNMTKSAVEYLQDLKTRMETAAEQAALTAQDKQRAYTEYYNRRSSVRNFAIGDQVFLLIPDSANKIYARWTGPGEIIQFCPPHSYKVKLPEGNIRQIHVNKIRKFHPRVNAVGVIFEHEEEFGEVHPTPRFTKNGNIGEVIADQRLDHLVESQQEQIRKLLWSHRSLLDRNVRVAHVGEHKIRLIPNHTRKKPYVYRIPEALKSKVDEQIEELLSLGLIEESFAEIAHPVVCVNKKDGTIRLCVDYRSLNSATVAEDFPMEEAAQLVNHIGKAKVITTLDLLKGYWAIPMASDSRDLTSFKTHRGEYRFKVMPFGLKNAAATFQREMNKALSKYRDFSRAYIDDIAVFSDNWEVHLQHLDIIFTKLEELGFTVNLNKCSFAKHEIRFLGHIIGSGKHRTDPEKVQAISRLPRPTTKKQLRSLLGLCNYYREYIPKYSELVFPLTELTKKKEPDTLLWTEIHDKVFHQLKTSLMDATALHTPVLGQTFTIETDASQIGISACLSQIFDGKKCPISFASQKLTPTQQAWSTIEREAYAVVWGLKKFETWIFGADIELHTDHNPLTFLTKCAPQSARLQRWAIALQKYNINVKHCPGSQLNNADALSRLF